ncbi:MAG: phenylacetate--CoA ligase family protein [Streptosporangiaceae bacterium]
MSPTATATANGLWERASAEAIRTFVTQRLLETIARAYEQVPFYRSFYRAAGLNPARLRTLSDIHRDVPLLSKADLLAFQDGHPLADVRQPGVRQIHLTSGTSGSGREVHLRDSRDLAALGTGGAYAYLWAGLKEGERLLLTIPYSQTMAGPYFQASCEAAHVVPVNGFVLDTEARVQALRSYRCAGLSATPSHLHRLTVVAREAGLKPAADMPSLRSIFLSGEPYGTQWALGMQEFWGARIHEGWGATQTMGVALATCSAGALVMNGGSAARGTLHGLDHRVFVEVLGQDGGEVEPGGRGEIVISTLRASAMPCIRFRMGDEVRRDPRPGCACGMQFSRYEAGTLRRLDNMIKIRGMNVWPEAVDDAILEMSAVADYRGSVYTDDDGREQVLLEVEILPTGRTGDLEKALERRVKVAVGITPIVRAVPPGTLADPAGAGDGPFKARRWSDHRAAIQEPQA